MKPLVWLARVFINTFGITQPTPENQNRMAIFIGVLLAAVLLAAVLLGVVAVAFVLRASFGA